MSEFSKYLDKKSVEYSVAEADLIGASRDASIFSIKPKIVVYPKSEEDISSLVDFVNTHSGYSLTPRAGGTDMTGGPLTSSIVIDVSKYLNKVINVSEDRFMVQPGMYFRDFDMTTRKHGYILPSFPASRDICTIGGMVANNSGGEKTLRFGKTSKYVDGLDVILSDGNKYKIKPLDVGGLQRKMSQDNFEGETYRKIYTLITKNIDIIKKSKPKVSKNSSGYALWDIWDGKIFDLTKLFVGSQGTLGIITSADLNLIHPKDLTGMIVIFLSKEEYPKIPELVGYLKSQGAETIEAYDKHTFRLSARYFYDFVKILGSGIISLFWRFLPEIFMTLRGGVPDMVVLAEFSGDNEKQVKDNIRAIYEGLRANYSRVRMETSAGDIAKYRAVRRSSFQLLRTRMQDLKPASFIDDLIVPIDSLPKFLPELEVKLSKYDFVYTVAGHLGDGNFHIIPLLNQSQIQDKQFIKGIMTEIYDLVLSFGGSISAEHNDGLLRVDYLKKMFGHEMYDLMVETKKIFDPKNIFNPGKKIKIP